MKIINFLIGILLLLVFANMTYGLTWTSTLNLPNDRVDHASFAYRSPVTGKTFLYVIAGSAKVEGSIDKKVHIAEIQPNGGVSNWRFSDGVNLPGRAAFASVLYEDGNDAYIYVIGGLGCQPKVHYAKIIDPYTGDLGPWVQAQYNLDGTITSGCLGTDVVYSSAVVDGNTIYLIGGRRDATYVNEVKWVDIQANGNIGQWQFGTPITIDTLGDVELAQHTTEVITVQGTKYVYIFGGAENNVAQKIVLRKRLSDIKNVLDPCPGAGCWLKNNNDLPTVMRNHASFLSLLSFGTTPCPANVKYAYISYDDKMFGACFDVVDPQWVQLTSGETIAVKRFRHSSASLYQNSYLIAGIDNDIPNQPGLRNVYYTMPQVSAIHLNINPDQVQINSFSTVTATVCVNGASGPGCDGGNFAPDGTLVYFSLFPPNTNIGSLNFVSAPAVNGIATATFTSTSNIGTADIHAKAGSIDVNKPVTVFDPNRCIITSANIVHPTDTNYVYPTGSILSKFIGVKFKITTSGLCNGDIVNFRMFHVDNDTGARTNLVNGVTVNPITLVINDPGFGDWQLPDLLDPADVADDGDETIEYMFEAEIVGESTRNSGNWIEVDTTFIGAVCGNGAIDSGEVEQCDCPISGGLCIFNNLGDSCTIYGYTGGTLDCVRYAYPNQCRHDLTPCSGRCGNGVYEPQFGENCDPSDPALNGLCPANPYLRCANDCTCISIQPGLQTILTKTECADDGNNDLVGSYRETTTLLNLDTGARTSTTADKECTLVKEVFVPFFTTLNIILVLFLVSAYYLVKQRKNS